jgi:hypothetical protein
MSDTLLDSIRIYRTWAMPNRQTFQVPSIKRLLGKYSVGRGWADPFAGKSIIAEFRNDIDPENGQPECMDAIEFMGRFADLSLAGVVLDPPYSIAQVNECYNGNGHELFDNSEGCSKPIRDAIAPKVRSGGHVISFGWSTTGIGLKRGFQTVEILIVCHGASHNDTLCTVERKNSWL